MNENDPFAQIFRDTPRFEVPPVSNVRLGAVRGGDPFAQVFPDAPLFEAPHDLMFDSDADGVIDPWDCQPFNPDADGWFGDAWRRVTSRVRQATRVDYGRAAARRATVRRAVSRRVAPVTRRVRAAVARAPVHVSRERAAVRRADVKRVIARKAAPVTAAVRAAVARAPIHPSGERAVARRAGAASALGVDFGRAADRRAAVVSGISAFAAKMSPIGVAAAAPGEPDKPGEARQRMIDSGVLKDRPTTITTGVGGVPGQPDRAGDVHAYVGVPTTAPGYWGEDAPGEALVGETEKPLSIFGWTPFTAEMDVRAEAMTARQQAKFPEGTISKPLMWFQEKTAGVAEFIRSAEQPAEMAIVGAYPTLPQPVRRLGIGAFIKAPAAVVEMVGMVPLGVEAAVRRPSIIPSAAAVGAYTMGKGMVTSFRTDPFGTAGELVGMGVLARAAPKAATKPIEFLKFRGKEFVPAETIVSKRVLTGGQGKFPTVSPSVPPHLRPSVMLKAFKESRYKLPHEKPGEAGWHATVAKFAKKGVAEVGARPATAPGLHIAPSASIHFLRLQSSPQVTFFGVPSLAKAHPGLLRIGVQSFERMPKRIREAGTAERVRFIYEQKGIPKAHISPAVESLKKTELESIIAPGTDISRTAFRYYTTVEGKKVPIYEYKAVAGDIPPKRTVTSGELTHKYGKELGEYYYDRKSPVITPASYALPYRELDYKPLSTREYYPPRTASERYAPPVESERYTPPPVEDRRYYTMLDTTERYAPPPEELERYVPPPPDHREYYPPPAPTERYVPPPPGYGEYTPPPPPGDVLITTPTPTPFITKPKPIKQKEKPIRRRRLKPRGPFDWFLKHEMMTLEGFLGGAAKPASGAFSEPDLGSPVAAKRAGGKRAKSPGLLDVPPGW